MARSFRAASSEYGAHTTAAPVTVVPLTMVAWVRLAAVGASTRTILAIKDKDNTNTGGLHGWFLEMNASEQIVARASGATSGSSTYTTTALSAGTWAHAGGVFAGDASRTGYYNGLPATASTSSRIPTGPDSITAGAFLHTATTPVNFWDGDIFWPAIWNVALSTDEIALLSAGMSPELIRPNNLVFFGREDDQRHILLDAANGKHMTLTGTEFVPSIPARVAARLPHRTARIYGFPSGSGISGTASITEAADTVSATGTVAVAGTASITEAADTVASTGTVAVAGTASITEAADTVVATGVVGDVPISGTASITEADDTIVSTGAVAVAGTAAITEADDTVAGTGAVAVAGSASITEADDTVVATGTSGGTVYGEAAIAEADDTVSATGEITGEGDARANGGLSPWVNFAPTEPADDRQARIRSQRERMGILEVVERFDAQEASRAIPTITRRDSDRKGRLQPDNLPPAPSSESGTADVLSLRAAREAQADRARLLAVLEVMEARKQIDIRRRMALLLLAAEA